MDARAATRCSRVLLTGPPGIGKTTICKKLVSMLESKNCKFDGFYTEEVRSQNNARIGFDIVPIKNTGKKSPLARAENVITEQQRSKHRVGNYHVFVNEFEAVALPLLNSDADVLFIDEIGKMELFSKSFFEKVNDMFFGSAGRKSFIIATIPQKHKVPQRFLSFFEKLHTDNRSKIIEVNRQNRDKLPEEIVRYIS